MIRQETVKLVAIVQSLCPGQKWEQGTPEAWHWVLGRYSYPDCEQALRVVYSERGNPAELGYRRIEPDDIEREVKAIRLRRLEATPAELLLPPAELANDPRAEREWMNRAKAAAADGRPIPGNGRGELKARNMQALTQHASRSKMDA